MRVTPTSWQLYEPTHPEKVDFKAAEPYLKTQVSLLTSDRVLAPAIASSEIVNLSTIKNSDDPREFLREHMKVEIVKDAYLIRVALELPDGNQAAAIVNAVVHSYLLYNGEHQRSGNSTLRKSLAEHDEEYKKQISEKRDELRRLYQAGTTASVPRISLNASGKVSDPTQPRLSTVTETQARRVADEIINSDLELIKAQSVLEVTEAASNAGNDPHARQVLGELRLNVAALLKQRESQAKYFQGLKVEKNVEKPAVRHCLRATSARRLDPACRSGQHATQATGVRIFAGERSSEPRGRRRGSERCHQPRPDHLHGRRADCGFPDSDGARLAGASQSRGAWTGVELNRQAKA